MAIHLPQPLTSLRELREDLPATKEGAYFQTGTYGPTPNTVLKVVSQAMAFEAQHGPATSASRVEMGRLEEAARNKLARLLNVEPDEVAIMTNTSQAMQRVIRGVEWKPGDEFIVSSLEHVSTTGICWELERRHQVVIKTIPADRGDAAFLEALKFSLTAKTKLVCLSEIASTDGRKLPVADTAALAHEHGVPVVVDGAQSVGQYPVDVQALGCDFFVGSGHKWLLGPMGTGFLIVALEQLQTFKPDYIPDHHPWTLSGTSSAPVTAKWRAEIGTYNHAMVIGLGFAVDNALGIGLDTIQAHAVGLSANLRGALREMRNIKVLTPPEAGNSAGITSFMVNGYTRVDMDRLSTQLWEQHRILVKAQWLSAPPIPDQVAMRVSIAGFNTEEEVDRLITGVQTLAAKS